MQTTRPGGVVRKADATIAKNYLSEPELQVLHRIVNLYIEFAELQALERKAMTMRDWVDKLDEFLKASGRKLLDHAGTISAEGREGEGRARVRALPGAAGREALDDRYGVRGDREAAREAGAHTREEGARRAMRASSPAGGGRDAIMTDQLPKEGDLILYRTDSGAVRVKALRGGDLLAQSEADGRVLRGRRTYRQRAPAQRLRQQRAGPGGSSPETPDDCRRRQVLPRQLLRPRRDHFRRLPREQCAGHAVRIWAPSKATSRSR